MCQRIKNGRTYAQCQANKCSVSRRVEEDCVPEPSVMCELPLRSRDGHEHKSGRIILSGLMSVLTTRVETIGKIRPLSSFY